MILLPVVSVTFIVLLGFQSVQAEELVIENNEQGLEDVDELVNEVDQIEESEDTEVDQDQIEVDGYRLGDDSEDIATFKHQLSALGYLVDSGDDGVVTEALLAVSNDYQKSHDLLVTDYISYEVLSHVDQRYDAALKLGDEGETVIALRESLYILGYLSPSDQAIFDLEMSQAVKAYQESLNLASTGLVEPMLLTHIHTHANGPLMNPMYREDAIFVKDVLSKFGFGEFSNTNYFGPQTESALRAFQVYYGLSETGRVDEPTLLLLKMLNDTPFQSGQRDPYTIKIKQYLSVANLWETGLGTHLYGSQTSEAVAAFQKQQNLVVNGILDPITEVALRDFATQSLRDGMYREDVVDLKAGLQRLGFGTFSKTVYFGPQTETALMAFQKHYGLNQTGIFTDESAQKLKQLLDTNLKTGKRSEAAVELKKALAVIGYWSQDNPTTLYGTQTESAVKNFQRDHALPVSGIADYVTLNILNEKASGDLKRGMYRQDAIKIKEQLMVLGYGSFAKTNFFGPKTEETLIVFQKDHQIPKAEYGVVGEQTRNKLKELLSTPYKEGKRHEGTIRIKEYLTVLGYWTGSNPTNLYGPQTRRAIEAFQKDHNLYASGIVLDDLYELLKAKAEGPLVNGMYREDVIQVKFYLEKMGFGTYVHNDYYGPMTANRVAEFQKYYGLKVSGEVDQSTKSQMEHIYHSALHLGQRSQEVIELKESLKVIGFWPQPNPTEYFGVQTEAVVREFQRRFGLVENGRADKVTMAELKKLTRFVLEEYELSNAEQEVLRLVNEERAKVGASVLAFDPQLSFIAYVKSGNMVELNYFDHISPTYGDPFNMMDQFGYVYLAAGENIAAGYRSASEVVDAWMKSPGHRANILNPVYQYIGIGEYQRYWTQLFSSKTY